MVITFVEMSFAKNTVSLIQKELTLEFRNKVAFGGVVLYVAATIFLIYLSMNMQGALGNLEVSVWNILFWLVVLFSAVNTTSKIFFSEGKGRHLYYFQVAKPEEIIFSKIIYNGALLTVITLISYGVFNLVLGSPVEQHGIFLITILLGAYGFSTLFTLTASIASKAGNNTTLMAVLGFPIIIPIIIFTMRLSREAYFTNVSVDFWKSFGIMAAYNVILVVLSLILFPYLWRD